MKVEGGGVATSNAGTAAVLHKIKVKEEAKEACCSSGLLQSSPVSSSSAHNSPSASPPAVRAIGAIATITISSGKGAAELATTAAVVGKPDDDDALPVNLDLKSRSKGPARDKICRDDANGSESRGSSSPSPSSSPGSQHAGSAKARSRPSRSPEAAGERAGATLHPVKTEAPDQELRQQEPETKCEANGTASRCISGIFAAHGKLKRLLGTLVHFAMDISAEAGETVRSLVLGLLSGSMSAEEFHSALQEATNFPLRGFVLPYLKHTLPSLQRDLSAAARADNQSCAQYLRSNEVAVLEAVGLGSTGPGSAAESGAELFAEQQPAHHYAPPTMRPAATAPTSGLHAAVSPASAHLAYGPGTHHPVKRRASDALYYENGGAFEDGLPYAKRSSNPWSNSHHHPHPHHHHNPHHHQSHLSHQQQQQHPDVPYSWYSMPGQQHPHGATAAASLVPSLVQIAAGGQPGYAALAQAHLPGHQQPAIAHSGASASGGPPTQNGSASLDDEWKNIHVMLNCILGMVEKTKRALAILQKRGCSSPASASLQASVPSASANGGPVSGNASSQSSQQQQQIEGAGGQDRDGTFKRISGEIVAQTIRATEDRVAEVKRRAEEAVQEVKRAAVAEVQRAVAAAVAESRASERLRGQRYFEPLPVAQQQQQQRLSQQQQHGRPSPFLRLADSRTTANPAAATPATPALGEESEKEAHVTGNITSSCWNCGRPALETCGGCGVARYCGSFCQHRDWEAGGHHSTCASSSSNGAGNGNKSSSRERARSSTPSPPTRSASDSEVASSKPALRATSK